MLVHIIVCPIANNACRICYTCPYPTSFRMNLGLLTKINVSNGLLWVSECFGVVDVRSSWNLYVHYLVQNGS